MVTLTRLNITFIRALLVLLLLASIQFPAAFSFYFSALTIITRPTSNFFRNIIFYLLHNMILRIQGYLLLQFQSNSYFHP